MGKAAVARAEAPRGCECRQLVAAQIHPGLDRAVQLAPGRVDLRPLRERTLVVRRHGRSIYRAATISHRLRPNPTKEDGMAEFARVGDVRGRQRSDRCDGERDQLGPGTARGHELNAAHRARRSRGGRAMISVRFRVRGRSEEGRRDVRGDEPARRRQHPPASRSTCYEVVLERDAYERSARSGVHGGGRRADESGMRGIGTAAGARRRSGARFRGSRERGGIERGRLSRAGERDLPLVHAQAQDRRRPTWRPRRRRATTSAGATTSAMASRSHTRRACASSMLLCPPTRRRQMAGAAPAAAQRRRRSCSRALAAAVAGDTKGFAAEAAQAWRSSHAPLNRRVRRRRPARLRLEPEVAARAGCCRACAAGAARPS